MALVLLVTMALVVRSLDAARHADPGFDPDSGASVLVDVRPVGPTATTGRAFHIKALRHL